MCTLSWAPLPGGYALAMNRDEQFHRAAGLPPGVREIEGVAVLCPTDGEAGGSWITVNASPVSRGLLVLELAGAASIGEIEQRLRGREGPPCEGRPAMELALEDAGRRGRGARAR